MKKLFKISFLVLLVSFSVAVIGVVFTFILCPTPAFDAKKLEKNNANVCFYDAGGKMVSTPEIKNLGGLVSIDELSKNTVNAFIAVEDKRFFKHRGIDYRGILRAVKSNLFSRSFKQGASTISQQLIKNTHLTAEKTISRKIAEIKLTKQLERKYSKREILQLYLNHIYFGEGVYGLQNASLNYFCKNACDLSLSESACLAACVKSPANFNPRNAKCLERRNLVLRLMNEQGYIGQAEYQSAKSESITTQSASHLGYFSHALEEAVEYMGISPYFNGKLQIYTHFDANAQEIIKNALSDLDCDAKAIITDNSGRIIAEALPLGDFERMPASTIKPLLCYAPALDMGKVFLSSKILDEKCDFNGYAPANYGDKYHGWVTVEQAISLSLNVPAVKVLDLIGVKNAKSYISKFGIEIEEDSLNVALGGYKGGVTLTKLCAAYNAFINGGEFFNARYVDKVVLNGKTVYSTTASPTKVFREGTCDLINHALTTAVKSGTAKALSDLPFQVCAKTGTCGNASGNTDAYTVCYTSQNVVGIWLGNADNRLIDNFMTGAYCAKIANGILKNLYQNNCPCDLKTSNDCIEVNLCKLAYEHGEHLLTADNTPERFCLKSLFLKGCEPTKKSTYFCNPKIDDYEISVKDNNLLLTVKKSEHVFYRIDKTDSLGNKFSFESCEQEFCDNNLINGNYLYEITPFVKDKNGEKIFGEKITLPQIKISKNSWYENENWWED